MSIATFRRLKEKALKEKEQATVVENESAKSSIKKTPKKKGDK